MNVEPCALAGVDLDPTLVVAGHVADDGQTEPGAAGVAAAAVVDPVEALEDPVEVAGRDADADVGHRQADLAVGRCARDLHGGVLVGEGHGVLEQAVDGRDQLAPVAEHVHRGDGAH